MAALWAAAISLVLVCLPIVAAWVTSPHTSQSWTQTLRSGAAAWLAIQGVPLTLGSVTVSLLPVGLAVIPLLLLWHALRWAVRATRVATPGEEAYLVIIAGLTYAGIAAAISVTVVGDGLVVDPVRAAITCGSLAVITSLVALLGEADTGARLRRAIPAPVRVALRGGFAAAALIVASAALLCLALLALSFGQVMAVAAELTDAAGPLAGLLVALLGIGYVPAAVAWATGYLTGPGVVIGSTTLAPGSTGGPGPLPDFPLLAAVPDRGPAWTWTLLAVPVVAGLVGGLVATRSVRDRRTSAGRALGLTVGVGAVAGVAVAAVTVLGTGSLGTARLAYLGPAPLLAGLAAAGLVGLGALVAQLMPHHAPDHATTRTGDHVA